MCGDGFGGCGDEIVVGSSVKHLGNVALRYSLPLYVDNKDARRTSVSCESGVEVWVGGCENHNVGDLFRFESDRVVRPECCAQKWQVGPGPAQELNDDRLFARDGSRRLHVRVAGAPWSLVWTVRDSCVGILDGFTSATRTDALGEA